MCIIVHTPDRSVRVLRGRPDKSGVGCDKSAPTLVLCIHFNATILNLVITIFLLIAVAIGLIGIDPLQLALLASTVIALFLPISLSPFLILMNDPQYLGKQTNGRLINIAMVCILLLAFGVAIVSLPLEIITGGG